MYSEGNVSTTVTRLVSGFCELGYSTQTVTITLALAGGIYLAWRLWRFTLCPILWPQEPPQLPYWIPVVGHAISMYRNQEAVLEYGRAYFQCQPFALTVAGKTLYFQTAVDDIVATYKNNTTISFDDSVKEIMASWGLSEEGAAKMWETGRQGVFPNPHGKPFGSLSRDMRRLQLESSQGLSDITGRFEQLLDPYLRKEGIPPASILGRESQSQITVSLMQLCQLCIIPAGTDTFFGTKLRQMAPKIDTSFVTFDTNAWQLLFQLPPSMAKEMHDAKRVVTDALGAFTELAASEKEDASWMISSLDEEMESMALSTSDRSTILFMIYWLINVNSFKLSFWLLAFILSSPSLCEEIRSELSTCSPESSKAGEPTMAHILQSCPILNAVFDEALRITVSTTSTRNVLSDTVLNGWLYRAGAKIMIPYRQLHFTSSTFGPSPNTFDHTRFLQKKGALSRSTQFKPFGGGNTLCTGRFIARREVLLMVARMLGRFDMELCENQRWPEMDMLKPGLGVMEPKAGNDLKVRLQERRSWNGVENWEYPAS